MCLFGGDSTGLGKIRELLTKSESKRAVPITRSDLAPLPLSCGNKVVELGSWSFSIECDGRFWRHTAASFRHAMPGFCEHFLCRRIYFLTIPGRQAAQTSWLRTLLHHFELDMSWSGVRLLEKSFCVVYHDTPAEKSNNETGNLKVAEELVTSANYRRVDSLSVKQWKG